jgi:site-specific DNA-methyltransferase (adenine-specific)
MPLNQLFYGDNLKVLREYIKDESVDLIYLDPPFNSRQDYNVLFAEKDGTKSSSQITAFEDTWEWNIDAEHAYQEIVESGGRVSEAMQAFRTFLGSSDMMAYLAMMAPRLVELRRVLKETGSIYLHCDATAVHYLKILMDAVFGPEKFRNEVIWKRTSAHGNASTKFAAVHDSILFYTKSEQLIWNQSFAPYSSEYIEEHFVHKDPDGRLFRRVDLRNPSHRPNLIYDYLASNGRTYKPHANGWVISPEQMRKLDSEGRLFFPAKEDGRLRKKIYIDESPGVPVTDVWNDLPPIHASSQERLGYPTQKPEALLERIIKASSNEGDVVLDPFCGCGTAVVAAQSLNRRWIGIDVTHLSIGLIKKRLSDKFGENIRKSYEVHGEPTDFASAQKLAEDDKFQFEAWALSLVGARHAGQIRRGADHGIDGKLFFHDDKSGKSKLIVISVKGGGTSVPHVRDLRGVIDREKAAIGVLITLEEPSKPMIKEAAGAGFYQSENYGDFEKIQILTIEQLLQGKTIQHPRMMETTFKKAPKAKAAKAENLALPLTSDSDEG